MTRTTRPHPTKLLRRTLAGVLAASFVPMLAAGSPSAAAAAPTELFMSEYIEGSSFNKAIEIYNGTGGAVDLDRRRVHAWSSTATARRPPARAWRSSGTIADGDVFVLAHGSADPAILAVTDLINSAVINFNGDDAVVLRRSGAVVDAFGQIGFDPGSQWAGGGQDDTLRRNETVCAGDTNADDAFDASVEWTTFANNTFDGLGTHSTVCGGGSGPADPVINEFSASTTSTDVEYVEIFGPPNTDLSALTVLEIEGDNGSAIGSVDEVIAIGTTDADGLYLASLPANALENGSISLLLVDGFSGAALDDLDSNDDGTFDMTPWTSIVDGVAVNDGGTGDVTYAVALGPNYDGVSSFAPGGASRIPDGTDTNTSADWVRNDFDLAGIPGFAGTASLGEAYNTPGALNQVFVTPPEACGDPITAISAIQGSGASSPLVGTDVAIEGTVVADFQTDSDGNNPLGGFYVQDAGDADPATSDGIYVFDASTPVAVGDVVHVRGIVTEFFGQTELSPATNVLVCGTGAELPAPVVLELPVASLDTFESVEGMLVTFPQDLVISEYFNYDRFGEIVLTSERLYQPTAIFDPGSPEATALTASNALSKITLDDGRTNQNPDPAIHPNGAEFTLDNLFRGGDTVAGVTGVMDYSFGLYRIQPTQGADYQSVNPRTAAPDDVGGNLKVASFNVLNYFTTLDARGANNDDEFQRQRAKIISAITAIDADVVGLIEIENNTEAIADLVAGLNATGAGPYDYVDTGVIGTDEIKVAFVYQPASATPIGDYAILDGSVDPRFVDTKNRPALAQTFMSTTTGGMVTVAVNHLKSKGSACDDVNDPDLGDGAGNCNITRTLAAQALSDWMASDPTGTGVAESLIIGDLNSYDKEDPIDALIAGGYTDLVSQFAASSPTRTCSTASSATSTTRSPTVTSSTT